ncbi:MAG: DUF1302 family protein [bacterium]
MTNRAWLAAAGLAALAWMASAGRAGAFFVDEANTLSVVTKLQARISVRTDDSTGFTFPRVEAGDLVQQRNLALVEINHDLRDLTRTLDLMAPLRALDLSVTYHLLGRFLYEGVYDYGAEPFQDVQERDPENIDAFKQSYELWEAYADIYRGPLSLRIGRQNLSWGETDVFRLLDSINPLDNTFGGPFEDLDDRRIPLWMLRGSYNLGTVGPASSLTLEGFWVPGFWDAHVAPFAPVGTPYAVPLPTDLARFLRFSYPDKKMENSRWGFRLMGMLAPNWNVAIAHYKTFPDAPALRAVVDESKLGVRIGGDLLLTDINAMYLEASYPGVQITGASTSYWEPHLDAVLRGEVAWFRDEPMLIPEENLSVLFGPVLPLPDQLLDLASRAYGVDIRKLGLSGIPLNPRTGTIPERDVLRYMIGIDRQTWIRALNRASTFYLSFQCFGQWIPDYDKRMRQGLSLYPMPVDFAAQKETEHILTGAANSTYWHGRLTPQLALAYDVRGAWLVQPSLNCAWDPFRLMLQYSSIFGQSVSFGAFRDRDQATFIVTYLMD